MIHKVELIKKTTQTTTRWSGGTTTQLAIWPNEAVYSERNFGWRISSAVVEDETSEFTKLPGYWRYLMILEGELELHHVERDSCHLKTYDVDSFSGHWQTHSKGKVRDFNLMHNLDCTGGMVAVSLEGTTSQLIGADYGNMQGEYRHLTEAYYGAEGSTLFMLDDCDYLLEQGDLLLVTSDDLKFSFKVKMAHGDPKAVFVRTHILYK